MSRSKQSSEAAVAPKLRLQVCARRREAILRVATDIFYEIGPRDATMEDIAGRLHTSKVAIYRNFSTKDEIVAAVLQRVSMRFIAAEYLPWSGLKRHYGRVSPSRGRMRPPTSCCSGRA